MKYHDAVRTSPHPTGSRYRPMSIIEAYRVRWQIELLFTEWKSYANLKRFNTGKPQFVAGLILAILMAATLKRYLANCTQVVFPVDVSIRTVAMCSIHVLTQVIAALFCSKKTGSGNTLSKALHYVKDNARRAHPRSDPTITQVKDIISVEAEPVETEFPTILDCPVPKLLCYSRESAIAEKFEAMLKLGQLNSRMKDFYDIWLLSRQFDFDGKKLVETM